MRWLCWLIVFISAPLMAKVSIKEQFKFYQVQSEDSAQLLHQVNHASVINKNGYVHHGHTAFSISWDLKFKQLNTACIIADSHTQVELIYTLPQLKSHNQQVQNIWYRWQPKLKAHELKHGQYVKSMAGKIDATLQALSAENNCEQLVLKANKQANKHIKQLQQLNKQFDKQTNHGETDGALLLSYL